MCLPICIFLGSLFFSMRCIVFSASDLVFCQLFLRDCCLWRFSLLCLSAKAIKNAIRINAVETILIAWRRCLFLHGSLLCFFLPHHSNLHRHIHDPQQERAPDAQDHDLDYSFHLPSSFFESSYSNLVHSSHLRSLCPSL